MPDEEVGQHQAGPVVPAAGLEDLAVRGVVPEKGELGHQHAQHGGTDQLPPAVADQDEADHPRGEDDDGTDELGPVVAVAAAHQPEVMHGTGQGGERASVAVRSSRTGGRGGGEQ